MKNRITFYTKPLTILLIFLIAGSAFTLPPSTSAQYIRWAGEANPSASLRSNILHAPDNTYTPLDPPILVSRFGSVMPYRNLHHLLGVSRDDLARADVLMFEGNGGSGAGPFNGWESAVFTFSDGISSRTVNYNELTGPASDPTVIATGTIENADYRSFFGMCTPNPNKISYLLLDLHSTSPAIDAASPLFQIFMANGNRPDGSFGEGTPDPDAVGIFSSCPPE
jgi:hypothetical protein